MKLTVGNIKFVKELSYNGTTYAWHVAMKSNMVSDSRHYVNYDKSGKTTRDIEYPFTDLPKTVQNFILSRPFEIFNVIEDLTGEFIEYIYRAQ